MQCNTYRRLHKSCNRRKTTSSVTVVWNCTLFLCKTSAISCTSHCGILQFAYCSLRSIVEPLLSYHNDSWNCLRRLCSLHSSNQPANCNSWIEGVFPVWITGTVHCTIIISRIHTSLVRTLPPVSKSHKGFDASHTYSVQGRRRHSNYHVSLSSCRQTEFLSQPKHICPPCQCPDTNACPSCPDRQICTST